MTDLNRPYKIAHISDPHLSRRFYREHIKSFKRLLGAILDQVYDHIVITGDLVSTADPNDYLLARELLNTFGLLDAKRLTVVPGNHDIFGGPHRAVDVLSFPHTVRMVNHRRMFALFEEAFAETFEGTTCLIPEHAFPFIKHVGPFAIIGINSVPPWSLRLNPLGSNGMLDDAHISALCSGTVTDALRMTIPIVAIHHHFNDLVDASHSSSFWRRVESRTMRMRRRRRRKTIRILRNLGVQAVLHGHVHRNEVYERDGMQFLNGAGAVCDDPVQYLKYNQISWNDYGLQTSICTLQIPYTAPAYTRTMHRFVSMQAVTEMNEN